MAVKLRLVRIGKKKQPTYRLVAADSRSPRNGRFIEIVGTYAPRGKSLAEPDAVIEIDNAKAVKWLSQGATPTERVEKLLKKSGAKVVEFVRYEVGSGIEKKQDDFVGEVMAQVKSQDKDPKPR